VTENASNRFCGNSGAVRVVITTAMDKTPRIWRGPARWVKRAVTLLLLSVLATTQTNTPSPEIEAADIGNGITLHYMEAGTGTPVIFVHGSLSDGGYWADQLGPFAQHYHAIAYSLPQAGYGRLATTHPKPTNVELLNPGDDSKPLGRFVGPNPRSIPECS
jgi:hypothetical protein